METSHFAAQSRSLPLPSLVVVVGEKYGRHERLSFAFISIVTLVI